MAAARAPGAPPAHGVYWQILRDLQNPDEERQRDGGRKLRFHWLSTAKHINKTGFSRMRVGLAVA
eukprot:5225378-Prymnesium_polylepis.1